MKEYHYQSKNRGANQQRGGPITTTMAVQNDSTNRSLNTKANWIKKQVEDRKKTQLAGESLKKQQRTIPPDSKGEKEKGWRTNPTLIRAVFLNRFQLTCGSSLDKKQTAVSQVIECTLQV